MKTLLFIACGGAFGAVLRYAASNWVYALAGRSFPYGTLFVNVTGSLLIGLFGAMMLGRMSISPELKAGLIVGVLGSFTTFSAFSMDTLNLLERGEFVAGAINIIFSVGLCLLAVWLGVTIGKQL